MSRRAYYLAIGLFVTFMLALSVAIFPSYKELSLMLFYDHQYERAYDRYMRLYEEGDRSVSTVIPLVWLMLEHADVDRAIDILQKFVTDHPNSIEARLLLSRLYVSADRPYEDLMNLEKLYQLQASPQILYRQRALFGYYGEVDEEIRVLELIINAHGGGETAYRDLAYLHASQGQVKKAIKTLYKMTQNHPLHTLEPDTLELFAHLLIDEGMEKEAVQTISTYVMANPSEKRSLQLIYLLLREGFPIEGLKVFNLLSAKEQNKPAAFKTRINLMMAADQQNEAYQILERRFKADRLPRNLMADFLDLAVERQDLSLAAKIIEKKHLANISRMTIIRMGELVAKQKDKALAKRVMDFLEEDYLTTRPVIAKTYELAFIKGSSENEKALLQTLDLKSLDNVQKALLVHVYDSLGFREQAKQVLAQIDYFPVLDDQTASRLTVLYIKNDMVEQGLKLVLQRHSKKGFDRPNMELMWLLLMAAKGDEKIVDKWIQSHPDVGRKFLIDLYYAASDGKQADVAVKMAKELDARFPSPKHKLLLGQAYVLNNQPKKALVLYEKMQVSGYDVSYPYLLALVGVAAMEPEYLPELHLAIQKELEEGTLPERKQRELGYALFDKGLDQEATGIFLALAGDKPYKSPDVQALLSLWDKKLTPERIEWLEKRTLDEDAKEKTLWLQYLLWNDVSQSVIALVNREDLYYDKLADVYIEALIKLKCEQLLADTLCYLSLIEDRPDRLNVLAEYASGFAFSDIAEGIYQKVLCYDQYNHHALRNLGLVLLGKGYYSAAKYFLCTFMRFYQPDFKVTYAYGEILHFEKRWRSADCFFATALGQVQRMDEKSLEAKQTEAHAYYRLGFVSLAQMIACELIRENPKQESLRTDLASLLLDIEQFGQAGCLLACHNLPLDEFDGTYAKTQERVALEATRLRLYRDANHLKEALFLARHLLEEYPCSGTILAATGEVETSMRRWRRAVHFIDAALCVDPENEGYTRLKWDIVKEHLPFYEYALEYRKTGQTKKELINRFVASLYVFPFTKLSFAAESDRIRVKDFTFSQDGVTVPEVRRQKWREELLLTHDFYSGSIAKAAVFKGPGFWGGGVAATFVDYRGTMGFLAEYHRPNWEFSQTVVENGNRDRIQVSRLYRFNPWVEAYLELSANRYNLEDVWNAASTYGVQGLLTYRFPNETPIMEWLGEDSSASVNYVLDGEYSSTVKEKEDIFGEEFTPLPFVNREQHSGFLFIQKRFNPCFVFEGFGGVSYNRYGLLSFEPLGGVSFQFGNSKGLQTRFEFTHTPSTDTTGEDEDRIIVDAKYDF